MSRSAGELEALSLAHPAPRLSPAKTTADEIRITPHKLRVPRRQIHLRFGSQQLLDGGVGKSPRPEQTGGLGPLLGLERLAEKAAANQQQARRLERIHSHLPLGMRERLPRLLLGKAMGAQALKDGARAQPAAARQGAGPIAGKADVIHVSQLAQASEHRLLLRLGEAFSRQREPKLAAASPAKGQ